MFVSASYLRVLVSPAPAVELCDAVSDALSDMGKTLPVRPDADLDCAVWNLSSNGDLRAAITAVAKALATNGTARAIIFDVQSAAPAQPDSSLAGELARSLQASACAIARDQAASQWVSRRPLSLGPDGFAVRRPELFSTQSGSSDRAVLVEFGAPTQLLKVELPGVPADALARLCHAAGDDRGGLLHIGAYAGISQRSGLPFVLLECSDIAKSPLHRALAVLDIEAARYGGAVGRTVALSFLPLNGLLRTLAAHMPLDASPGQVIETRVEEGRS